MKTVRFYSLAAALAVAFVTAQAGSPNPVTITGPVTGISDGDTFYMAIEGTPTRLRLAQIDAPEKAQPFGRRAEQSLRDLIGKREVTATWTKADRYGRPIVQVEVDGVNVNAEQVRRGFAWVYRQYATDRSLYDLEAEARAARLGLWADPNAVEPWEWRKVHPKGNR